CPGAGRRECGPEARTFSRSATRQQFHRAGQARPANQARKETPARREVICSATTDVTGDRQDCQRISGKLRRKFMAVLSVPRATSADRDAGWVRTGRGWGGNRLG